MQEINRAATAWLLAATALVLLMTPGLAIFYGGRVRTTGVHGYQPSLRPPTFGDLDAPRPRSETAEDA